MISPQTTSVPNLVPRRDPLKARGHRNWGLPMQLTSFPDFVQVAYACFQLECNFRHGFQMGPIISQPSRLCQSGGTKRLGPMPPDSGARVPPWSDNPLHVPLLSPAPRPAPADPLRCRRIRPPPSASTPRPTQSPPALHIHPAWQIQDRPPPPPCDGSIPLTHPPLPPPRILARDGAHVAHPHPGTSSPHTPTEPR